MSSWNVPSPLPPVAVPPPADHLRPLSLGEVLDRTFSLYRRNFWLVAGISALSGAVQLLANLLQMLANHIALRHHAVVWVTVLSSVGSVGVFFVFFLASSFTQAATTYAISEVYLGRTTSITASLRAVVAEWWKFPIIGVWQFFSGAWPPLLLIFPAVMLGIYMRGQMLFLVGLLSIAAFAAAIGGFLLYLRNALAVPVQVIEHPGIRGSMRRSKTLTRGAKTTLFVLLLIVGALYMAAASLIGVFFGMGMMMHMNMADPASSGFLIVQSGALFVGFLIHTAILPIMLVGVALCYFNQRVKQEGFDLLYMLGPETPPAAETSPSLP